MVREPDFFITCPVKMQTQAQQQRQAFQRRLLEEKWQLEARRARQVHKELIGSRARRAQLLLELEEEEAYGVDLARSLGLAQTLTELPDDLLLLVGSLCTPVAATALSLCAHHLQRLLAQPARRAMRRHYQPPTEGRLETRELLQEAVFVSFVVRGALCGSRATPVSKPVLKPVPRGVPMPTPKAPYLDCHRCRQVGHFVDQCKLPCRHCRRRGHSEAKCPERK